MPVGPERVALLPLVPDDALRNVQDALVRIDRMLILNKFEQVVSLRDWTRTLTFDIETPTPLGSDMSMYLLLKTIESAYLARGWIGVSAKETAHGLIYLCMTTRLPENPVGYKLVP